ncbi:MAG: type IV toxin-antitoxin system AbiEi family antitoxin domain-containing protein [Actinobacteria bacterium]|nr:type IV toxin-antitoxin system AbiEi family antitoxin domain-containing protein [Actinomycetota bacterium]
MDTRFRSIAAVAASQHSVVSTDQLTRLGLSQQARSRWVAKGALEQLGPRSFAIAGSDDTWLRRLAGAFLDLEGAGVVAGRSGARLMSLDGFTADVPELLVPRAFRNRSISGVLRSTSLPIESRDVQRIGMFVVARAERLILDGPLFGFGRAEIENAIDSSIRRRLVSEQRLRTRVIADHRSGVNGSRTLLDALVDSGGESRLERMFLQLCRAARLPRPIVQKSYREGGRTIARVDAEFPGDIVVEVAGHGTHATRQQRQRDAQRHTELTLRGKRVLTFTYEDVRDRPDWVIRVLLVALRAAA